MNMRNFLPLRSPSWPLLALATALAAHSLPAQTVPVYINDGLVQAPPQVPPQIDALTFINNATFNIQGLLSTFPYATANTLNYTNRGTMSSSSGFAFVRYPDVGGAMQAESFYNEGVINSGEDSFFSFIRGGGWAALPQTLIDARTVVNSGPINLGANTLLSVSGENLHLGRASFLMSSPGFGFNRITTGGSYDDYWGMGFVGMNPDLDFGGFFASSPLHWVTNRLNVGISTNAGSQTAIYLPNPTVYLQQQFAPSNTWSFAVFLREQNPAISNEVFIDIAAGEMAVRWFWPGTDPATGAPITEGFYLRDDFYNINVLRLVPNGYVDAVQTYIPTNYTFSTFAPLFVPPATVGDPTGIFTATRMTNAYSAYQVGFLPNTIIPGETYGQTVERLPGRVQLAASSLLDLTRARVTADNTIILAATNQFVGTGAQLSAPFIDLDLATTNGTLTVSNLVVPSLNRILGNISLFSTAWTTVTDGTTNNYFVLFVDSNLQTNSPVEANQVTLRSDNVFLSDRLNIRSNILITATNVTLTTNLPGSLTPYGSLVIQPELVAFPNALPRLQNFTNHGVVSLPNATVFAGLRAPPWYAGTYTEPYASFINHGFITNQGVQIQAREFVNSGALDAGSGTIQLYSRNAHLNGGVLSTLAGDISLLATNHLQVSNTMLTLGRTLTLDVGSLLDDGSLSATVASFTNRNSWTVGRGFNLNRLPASSSLLATTITNFAPAYQQVPNVWAGLDKGNDVMGYQNNAALGRLVLTGGTNCSYAFAGTGGNNAIYVDRLELEGFAAARDANNNLAALDFGPNFRIYYAEAYVNGVPQAEKLDGQNDGRLIWVSSFAGFFSSTNIVYPNGTTNAVNSALAASCNLDSDNDGLVNCIDPTPVTVSGFCNFTLSATNANSGFEGGTGIFTVTDTNFCGYTVFSSNDWLTVVSGASGQSFGQVTYLVATNSGSAPRTGTLQVGAATFTVTQSAGGWVNSLVFGPLYYAGDGWYGGSAYGWMWFDPAGEWIWSTSLQGWLGLVGDSRTVWSTQFQWLTPSASDRYLAATSTLGPLFVGQFQGATLADGWVGSDRFGYVWAAGDGVWFYSSSYGWLGVTADGAIWSVSQNRFL
jgi:hypothetical protein